MPIKIPHSLPAKAQLEAENIFVMTETTAVKQDIRPLKIAIVNLMPTKITTETQLLRLLGNTPLQVDIELIKLDSHTPKNTPQEHLLAFYKPFCEIEKNKYDGLIITGAPVEHLAFEEVFYWDELCKIIKWSQGNVTSALHICWGAQAALYFRYGINKVKLDKKINGVFLHEVLRPEKPLLRGFDSVFYVPHSRWTAIEDIPQNLEILAKSNEAGIHIVSDKIGKNIYVFGHSEYDFDTLAKEYERDVKKGENPPLPYNYFPENNPALTPVSTWRAHANLFFSNWLNYHVYQSTPYDVQEIS